jgi:hypothetical protein
MQFSKREIPNIIFGNRTKQTWQVGDSEPSGQKLTVEEIKVMYYFLKNVK